MKLHKYKKHRLSLSLSSSVIFMARKYFCKNISPTFTFVDYLSAPLMSGSVGFRHNRHFRTGAKWVFLLYNPMFVDPYYASDVIRWMNKGCNPKRNIKEVCKILHRHSFSWDNWND